MVLECSTEQDGHYYLTWVLISKSLISMSKYWAHTGTNIFWYNMGLACSTEQFGAQPKGCDDQMVLLVLPFRRVTKAVGGSKRCLTSNQY